MLRRSEEVRGQPSRFERDNRQLEADFQGTVRHAKQHAPATQAQPSPRRTVKVKAGDTFSGIAAARHLPERALYLANPQFDPRREDGVLNYDRGADGGWDPDYLRPGDRLRFPAQLRQAPARTTTPGGGPPNAARATQSATPVPSPATATPVAAGPQRPSDAPAFVAPLGRLVPVRAGAGVEYGWKVSSAEPATLARYAKASWSIDDRPGGELNLNVKYKSAPPKSADAPGRLRTVDIGLVFGRKVEIGASVELRRGDDRLSWYASDKRRDLLVDSAKIKLGQLRPVTIVQAVGRGIMESVNHCRVNPQATERWAPLRDGIWNAVKSAEIQVSAEHALHPTMQTAALGTIAPKATLDDLHSGLRAPKIPAPGAAGLAGWAVGTAASFAGSKATDLFIGNDIRHPIARKAVDGLGAGLVGVAASTATQKAWPAVATRTASLAGKLAPAGGRIAAAIGQATQVAGKVAPLLGKAAPLINTTTRIAGKIAVSGAGKVLSKVVRVGGPVGALVAGVPDAVDAYKAFRGGDQAKGWRSVAKAGVRVGCTAAGAVALSFIPVVGTVAGAVAGGIVGDVIAGLF
jgi:hypothetical protein